MSHVRINYLLSRDGAPMRILPIGDGRWLSYCKLCDTEWITPDRGQAFTDAEHHTWLAEAAGDCKAGRAAQMRHEHRQRFGYYHPAPVNWRHASH